MPSEKLSEKLKSLGVQLGATGLLQKKTTSFPIEREISGFLEESQSGFVFYTHKIYEPGFRHGNISLHANFDFPVHTRWARIPTAEPYYPQDLLFLDTETTGLAGGTGTLVFMIGLGFFQEDGFHLMQLFLKNPADSEAFLLKLEKIAEPFKALVTYNGKSFDIPLLNSQCILNHFNPFLKNRVHYDLLALARRLWSNRLPNRTLHDVEHEILQVIRSSEEIPGWMIPQLYADYLRTEDSRPLVGVFYHNEIDILSLAALFVHTAALFSNPVDYSGQLLIDLFSIARLFEDLGDEEKSYILFDHCLKNNIASEFLPGVIHHLALYHRRRNEWDQAVSLWQTAAELDDVFSCIELAKYYEHVVKDYSSALNWSQKAFQISNLHFRFNNNLEEIKYRQVRLERRILNRDGS